MKFQTEDSSAMTVNIDHTSRDISGFSSLQMYMNHLKLRFSDSDNAIRAEIEQEWDTNHSDQPKISFVENYLHERFGFRVTATPYDAERHPRKPTNAQRESLESFPFYWYTVKRAQGGLFRWAWERTEVFPFSKIIGHPISFDEFGFTSGSYWEFSGGATRSMAESDLDAAPARWVGQAPFIFPLPGKDGIIITVDIVDLAVSIDKVFATVEDHWGGNFFGTNEDPYPRPARRSLQR